MVTYSSEHSLTQKERMIYMADFTKNAIRDSFVKLLEEKPLKQISVRDIVETCGINRNTFYYHYQDIPQLLESIVSDEAEQLVTAHPEFDSMESCLNTIIDFTMENKTLVMHIYKSVNRDVFEKYLWWVSECVMTRYVDGLIDGRKISDLDRETIIAYVKSVGLGLVLGWLEGGMTSQIRDFNHRMCQLKLGSLDSLIEQCIIP